MSKQSLSQYRVQQENIQQQSMIFDSSLPTFNLIQQGDTDSQQQQFNKREQFLRYIKQKYSQTIMKKQRIRLQNQKVVVGGSQAKFDMSEFFKFKQKIQDSTKQQKNQIQNLFKQVQGYHFVWILVLYVAVNNLDLPIILDMTVNRYIRFAWRYFIQNIVLLPFLMHQYRNCNQQDKNKYTIKYILNLNHIKKLLLSSGIKTLCLMVLLTSFDWTFIAHGSILCSLANFFLSLIRVKNSNYHPIEIGGQLLVIVGIVAICYDAYVAIPPGNDSWEWNTINHNYLYRNGIQRVIANIATLLTSLFAALFFTYQAQLSNDFPPFLALFNVNILIAIQMILTIYFGYGGTFDTDPTYGLFAVFNQNNFIGQLYTSIVSGFTLFVSFVMIAKMFSSSILPTLSLVFEPIISIVIMQMYNVQSMPGNYSCVGISFVMPGLCFILIGQWLFQKIKMQQQILDKNRLSNLIKAREARRQTKIDTKLRLPSRGVSVRLKDRSSINQSLLKQSTKQVQPKSKFIPLQSVMEEEQIQKMERKQKVDYKAKSPPKKRLES